MPKIAGPKLRKVTLNLNDEDVEDLGQLYGWGWSEVVRNLVHTHVQTHRRAKPAQTVGDLASGK